MHDIRSLSQESRYTDSQLITLDKAIQYCLVLDDLASNPMAVPSPKALALYRPDE